MTDEECGRHARRNRRERNRRLREVEHVFDRSRSHVGRAEGWQAEGLFDEFEDAAGLVRRVIDLANASHEDRRVVPIRALADRVHDGATHSGPIFPPPCA